VVVWYPQVQQSLWLGFVMLAENYKQLGIIMRASELFFHWQQLNE
jgi:hypothetical protein